MKERRRNGKEPTGTAGKVHGGNGQEKSKKNQEDASATSVNPPHKVLIALAREWEHARPLFRYQRDALITNLQ